MEIILGFGAGPVRFGMTEVETRALLGTPDKILTTECQNRDWIFNRAKLVLKFEPANDYRLGWLEIHHRKARWNGIAIFEAGQDQLLAELSSVLGEPWRHDDYGTLDTYFFADNGVEVQYELGALRCFNFGVAYDANDTPLWPIQH
ncbi:hypothetical protein [Chitinolyticbacter albus]|uniref:hypothetical protein n=1 Tax=Chitinolyticbacter albus TaxID=2961951 RepID=UPI00210CE769|nr:hypothetical protein [Chitinolyticbacter albus]